MFFFSFLLHFGEISILTDLRHIDSRISAENVCFCDCRWFLSPGSKIREVGTTDDFYGVWKKSL
jgi:hypothetical protein